MQTFNFTGDTQPIISGLQLLAEAGKFALSPDGTAITVTQGGKGFAVTQNSITYEREIDFFRAVSYVLQGNFDVAQQSAFSQNGYMLDCSRNAVATVPAVKRLLQSMSLMGLNTLQLYTEDTFEIPEWEYFGYQRGRYTADELKEIDTYAAKLGIELIPCVQTLAHLNAALRWVQFHDIIDCNDILLVGEEKTYKFIDDMMKQLASCFTSRNINIGMDEAHMLGLGKYLDKHGYQNRTEIMCRHLTKVVEICKKYGFKPMMWSDMFFRLVGGDYYHGSDVPFPKEILELLPPEVTLVYWDYYHLSQAHYEGMLKQHKKFPNPIGFAGGAWKWGGLAPDLRFNMHTSRSSLAACRATGVDIVFATGWGDNGAECPAFSVLPALQLQAECGYIDFKYTQPKSLDAVDILDCTIFTDAELAARFAVCTGGVWEDFFLLDDVNNTTARRDGTTNTSKPLLYQDVLLGLFDKHVDIATFPAHYETLTDKLHAAAKRNGEWGYLFNHMATLSDLLMVKSTVGIAITEAYRNGEREKLRTLANNVLPGLCGMVDELILSFETFWARENKPQGLEVIHIRLGGVRTRLLAAQRRINGYLDGDIERLEELEVERLGFNGPIPEGADINTHCNIWERIVSACPMNG
ncbi:MAG: beta-N-acetylhexosaminidase [Oscillospiraceae bacterium]|nr:beta-N-acetylhexosaminidase [Oscillospiraceae bacterium]